MMSLFEEYSDGEENDPDSAVVGETSPVDPSESVLSLAMPPVPLLEYDSQRQDETECSSTSRRGAGGTASSHYQSLSVEKRLELAEQKIADLSESVLNLDEMFIFALKSQCIVASTLASEHEVFDSIEGASGISKRMDICGVLANNLTKTINSLAAGGDSISVDDGGAYTALGALVDEEEAQDQQRIAEESRLKYAAAPKNTRGKTAGGARGTSAAPRGGRGGGAKGGSTRGGRNASGAAKVDAGDGGESLDEGRNDTLDTAPKRGGASGTRLKQLRDLSTPAGKKAAAQEASVRAVMCDGYEVDTSYTKRIVGGIAIHNAVGTNAIILRLASGERRVAPPAKALTAARINMNKCSTLEERLENAKLMAESLASFMSSVISNAIEGLDGAVIISGLYKREKSEKDVALIKKQGPLVLALIRCAGLECGMHSGMPKNFEESVFAKAVSNLLNVANQLKARKTSNRKKKALTLQQQDQQEASVDDDGANDHSSSHVDSDNVVE